MKRIALMIILVLAASVSALAQNETPKVIRGGVLNGKAVRLPKPEYPAAAKAAGVGGIVQVAVVIDENGSIESANAVRNEKEETEEPSQISDAKAALRAAAEDAALKAQFSPTLLSGNPVKVSGVITYNFVRDGDSGGEARTIQGDVLNGKAIELPDPEYPPAGTAVGAAGTVSVKVTVDEGGNVISATAISGHPLLRAAAVDAARRARFSPTLLNGEPVKISGVITYNFVADKPE
jgi:TonB family protein